MFFRNPQLTLLFCSLFLIMIGFGIVIPLLPFVARELGATSMDMGLLVTAWAAAQFIIAPRWGTFSDRVGRRPTIILGLVGFGFSFILMGLSTHLWVLYVARILGGLMSAATMPSASAYIADVTTREERGASMGLLGAAFGLGFMLGPTIGGLLAPLGVRFTFFIAGTCGWLNAILVYFMLPEPETRSKSGARGQSALHAVVASLKKPYAILLFIPFCMSFAGSVLFSMMAYYLMDKFAANESLVAIAFAVNGGIGVLTQGFFLGAALKLMNELNLLRIGMLVTALGFAGFLVSPSFFFILVCVALVSMGQGLARPVVMTLLSKATDMGQGVTMGLQSSYESLGRVAGPLWAGFVYMLSIEAPYASSALIYILTMFILERARRLLNQVAEEDARLAAMGPPVPQKILAAPGPMGDGSAKN